MRTLIRTVFDDVLYAAGGNVYTAARFNDLLGRYDQLAIQAVADQVTGSTPTLTVAIEHSGDARAWTQKNLTAEINGLSIPTTATTPLVGTDAGTTPSLGKVRLRLSMVGTSAHVKLHVTMRDKAKGGGRAAGADGEDEDARSTE